METENVNAAPTEAPLIQEPIEITNEPSEEVVEETPSEVEEPVEIDAPKPLPKKKDEVSSKFAALSRKERQLREREKELQSLQQQLEEQKSSRNSEDEEVQQALEFASRIKNLAGDKTKRHHLLKELETLGVTYDDITNSVLENGEPNPDKIVEQVRQEYKSEIQKLQDKLEAMESARQQEREEAEQKSKEREEAAALEDFMSQINSHINERPDEYKMIRYENASDLVYETIATYYEEHGRMLSNEDAANHVETYLREEAEKRAKALGFRPSEVPKAPPREEAPKPVSPTLSNEQSTQTPDSDQFSTNTEDEWDRIQRIASQLKFDS